VEGWPRSSRIHPPNPPSSLTLQAQPSPEDPLPIPVSPLLPSPLPAQGSRAARPGAAQRGAPRCGSRPGPLQTAPARGGQAARYSWKPGGEVMQPECCDLRPVVLGEEPGSGSGAVGAAGSRLRSELACRGKGFRRGGGFFPPRLSAESANPSKGFKIASATASAARPSDHPSVGHVSPPGKLGRCQSRSHAAPHAAGTAERPLLWLPPTYPHRPASPVKGSTIPSDPRAHPGRSTSRRVLGGDKSPTHSSRLPRQEFSGSFHHLHVPITQQTR